jgi:molybdate transport system substrate-binding protein
MSFKKLICLCMALLVHGQIYAADITLLASTGVSSMMKVVLSDFEKKTGHNIKVSYDTSNLLMKRIQAGESVDLVILTAPLIDELTQSGKLTTGSRLDLAKSGIGVAIQSGKKKPDISSPEALKKALLETNSVAYTATGASGIYFGKVIDQLGIGEQVRAKSKTPPGGIIAEIVAKGDAEMGVQMISELTGVKGTQLVGPLPGNLQMFTIFSAGMMKDAKDLQLVKSLMQFLTTPESIAVYKLQGMEPI